jgi:hypothetical protein
LAGLPTNEKSRIELALREAVLIFFKERAVFAPQEAAMLNLSPLRTKLAQGA